MITCTFENCDRTSLRHLTVNAIIVRDGKVLLGKRGTYNGKPLVESGKWALIGGYFDRDETITQAVKREVREETGYEINNLVLLRINDNPLRPHEDRQNVDFVFMADVVRENKIETEEVRELRWFDLDNLPSDQEIAFDHGEEITLYRKYLAGQVQLPILG